MAETIEVTYTVPAGEFDRDEFADVAEVKRVTAGYKVKETFDHTEGALWADNDGVTCELEDIVTNPHFVRMVAL